MLPTIHGSQVIDSVAIDFLAISGPINRREGHIALGYQYPCRRSIDVSCKYATFL